MRTSLAALAFLVLTSCSASASHDAMADAADDAVEDQVAPLRAKIDELESKISEQEQQINQASADLALLKANQDTLFDKTSGHDARISDVEGRLHM